MELSKLRTFSIEQCSRDEATVYAVDYEDSFIFLEKLDPKEMSTMEHELAIMHAASVIDASNKFKDNFNVKPSLHTSYIDHVGIMMKADTKSWCKHLNEKDYWPTANRRITNLVWNWLNKTLDDPQVLV